MTIRIAVPKKFPRADLYLYTRGNELDVRLYTEARGLDYQVFTFFNADERTLKAAGELLEAAGVPVAVFIDR